MKPEAQAHLDTARLAIVKAKAGPTAAAVEPALAENAARDAYYAAFHAAHALIAERADRTPKKHSGVHTLFNQLVRHEPAFPASLRTFIVKAYDFKAIADYDTTPPPRVSIARAQAAIDEAEQFVASVAALLPP